MRYRTRVLGQTDLVGSCSDLQGDNGNRHGTEIILTLNNLQYVATIQCAAGKFGRLVLVPAMVSEQRIEFLIPILDPPSFCPKGKFSGKFTSTGLEGGFEGKERQSLARQ